MPIRYGVLKCKPVDRRRGGEENPHYQIGADAGGSSFRISINVKSQVNPSELLYVTDEQFRHQITQGLPGLPPGFTPLDSKPGGAALDYIRGNLFNRKQMVPLAFEAPGEDDDLNDMLDRYVRRAMEIADAELYAFGDHWGPEDGHPDKIFGFLPGNGMHDIHMNQGNAFSHRKGDGVYQDGGLLFHFPSEEKWIAVFLAFQSQSWHTDDLTGHWIGEHPEIPLKSGEPPIPAVGAVYIAGAVILPYAQDGPQSVTLLNATHHRIDLDGWSLADQKKRKYILGGIIGPGEFRTVPITGSRAFFMDGGDIITLLNGKGFKVDGVAYTRKQVKAGRTLKF